MATLLPLLLAASSSMAAPLPDVIGADDLYQAFRTVCVDSPDITTARRLARDLPGAVPLDYANRPSTFRAYKTSQLTVGVLGNPKATCYVSGYVNADGVDRVAALLGELKGSPAKLRSRQGGEFRYADWGPQFQPLHFEAKQHESGRFQVLISVRNKKAK